MLKRLSDIVDNLRRLDEDETVGIDTRVKPVVRVIKGALDEDEDGSIILNGRIDPKTLRFLKVDFDYQRPLGERPDIWNALKAGAVVPNIDVGVRGRAFRCEGDDYLIDDDCYIVDGWQRVGTALKLLEAVPEHPVRIFATIHFGTNDLWERHRFTELNKNVKKVSPNLHLRNMRDSNEAVLTLYGLSNNQRDFALYHKVSWSQNMKRGELVTALQIAKVVRRLHAHLCSLSGAGAEQTAGRLAEAARKTSLNQFRKNVVTFFDVIDECWGINTIELRASAPQIKTTFMDMLARMFSAHVDFWDVNDRIFFVSADMRRKLGKFPINDPHVRNLAGSGGSAANILYELLVNHVNSGKRTGQLRSRYAKAA